MIEGPISKQSCLNEQARSTQVIMQELLFFFFLKENWQSDYYFFCFVIIFIIFMQADWLLGLRAGALIGRWDRLLTLCLYGWSRAETARKRLVFNSRCKATSLQLKPLTCNEHNRKQLNCKVNVLSSDTIRIARPHWQVCPLQSCVSHLVVGLLDVGAVSPLGQDDGLQVLPVQTATLRSISWRLRRRQVVLEGGN